MILRRLTTAFRKQDWFTVGVETLIVVFAMFIGLQVNNSNAARGDRLAAAQQGRIHSQDRFHRFSGADTAPRQRVEAEFTNTC